MTDQQGGWRPGVAETLGYYAYVLRDPADSKIFYVGKGTGDRCFSHIAEARKTERDSRGDYEKLARIRSIEDAGGAVVIEILRHGMDERTAYEVEAAVIGLFPELTNRASGHGRWERGSMSVGDLNAQYGAKPITIAPEHPSILIRVSRQPRRHVDDDHELYEATRKWWKVGPRRNGARYAMAVYGGVVRGVFAIEGWEPAGPDDIAKDPKRRDRWAFVGSRSRELEAHYLFGDVTAMFPQGNQTPFKYVNC